MGQEYNKYYAFGAERERERERERALVGLHVHVRTGFRENICWYSLK